MDRAKEVLEKAQFRAKGKWYLAEEVDSFLEELSVRLNENSQEKERLEEKVRTLEEAKERLEGELSQARAEVQQRQAHPQEERTRRVCRELEQERDGLIEDIKALRRFRESFRQAVEQDTQQILEQLDKFASQDLL